VGVKDFVREVLRGRSGADATKIKKVWTPAGLQEKED